jgi:hypothetical protein
MATSETCVPISRSVAEGLTQYLHTLPPEAWRRPSACEDWEVRDVVGQRRALVNFRPGMRLAAPVRYRFAVTGGVPGAYDLVVEGDQGVIEPACSTPAHLTCHCDTD